MFKETDDKYVSATYKRFPIEIVSGKGSVAVDVNGNEYIDMGSGIGVTSFGICDEQWQQAVTEQLGKLQHMSNLYYTEPCARLAELLCSRTGMKKVFFGNSGAEANETAIKAIKKYAAENKGSDYYTIITLENSFHGRTHATLAATGQEAFHKLYQPLTPGFVHTPANDLDALKKLVRNTKCAGIMIECVQGEGGVIPLDGDFIRGIEVLARENNLIFAVDEVQTGNGRTGELYSYMNFGIKPDVVTTAKGLAGGLPLGAVLFGEKLENIFSYGDNGSTFGGNPIACAGALSVLGRIDDELLAGVKEKSRYIFGELSGADGIESVSGLGLMIGVKTVKPAGDVVDICMKNGVLPLTAKDKVRLLPALNIPMDVLEKAVEVVKKACK